MNNIGANIPAEIVELDTDDVLAHKRSEFSLPEGLIYLDGNSLGAMPHASLERLKEAAYSEWRNDLISSWNTHDWIGLPTKVGEKIAPLLGAAPGQTLVCDSISVNLFKLLSAALQLNPNRSIVLSQGDNFPTDLYMAEGLSNLVGREQCELVTVKEEDLLDHLDESTAVLLLTQVNFRTGYLHNIEKITQRAHLVGAVVIWDLAHSAGALPLELDKWHVDFAVGCGYKYLNGGPGAPAFLYVASRHLAKIDQPLKGWMGHAKPFEFSANYSAAQGVEKFLAGTPNILSLAALDGALDVFSDVDMPQLREKSLKLANLFIQLLETQPSLTSLELISPKEEQLRGSQIALRHEEAYAITQALIDVNVIADFRKPDCLRFGFTPLYTRFSDIYRAVIALADIVASKRYHQEKFQRRNRVT